MKDLTVEGVAWAVLTTVLQLGLIIAVKICGYLLIGYCVKRFQKRKLEKKEKERLESGEELNYDYESDWEDVGESSSDSPDPCQGQGDQAEASATKSTKTRDASTTDDFITETDRLLATIRRRRMEDDLTNENLFPGKPPLNPGASNDNLSLRQLLYKYRPK